MNTPVGEDDAAPRTASQDARELIEALAQLDGQGDADTQIINLQQVREGPLSIGAVLTKLKDLNKLLADATAREIQVPRDNCPVEGEELEQFASDVRERKLDVGECRLAMSNLNTAVEELKARLESEWQAHCDRLLPELEGQAKITEALADAGIKGSARLHAKVKRAIGLRSMKFSGKQADDFTRLAGDIKPELQALKVPAEVVNFLGGAASGFSLNEFLDNDSIIEWLRENDLLGAFIVTTRSSQSM